MLLALSTLLAPAFAQAAPVAQGETFHYRGPSAQGTYGAEQIATFVQADPSGTHWVWQEGWASWKPAGQVDAIARAMAPATWTYAGPDGRTEVLGADAIAARVRAAPGPHLVWRAGMPDWKRPADVPELARALASSPPPLPTNGPPPLPTSAPPPLPTTLPTTPPTTPPPPPPVASPTAPVTPTASAPAAPAASPASPLDVGIEVRANLAADHLESAGDDEAADPTTFGLEIVRVRPRMDLALGRHARSKVTFDLHQDGAVTEVDATSGTVEVPHYADGWTIQGREIWVEASGGQKVKHRLRYGLQKPAFGVRDRYDDHANYHLPGDEQTLDLERRAGVTFSEDAGLGYRAEGGKWAADVQVLNGAGYKALDDNTSKDVILRVEGRPVGWANVAGFAQRGDRGADGSLQLTQYGLSAEVRGQRQRLVAEAFLGDSEVGGAHEFAGGMATGAWDLPAPAPLDQVTVLARVMAFDPDLGDDGLKSTPAEYPDAWWSPAGSVAAYWQTGGKDLLLTGLTWESWVPQDANLPVSHALVIQAAWKH